MICFLIFLLHCTPSHPPPPTLHSVLYTPRPKLLKPSFFSPKNKQTSKSPMTVKSPNLLVNQLQLVIFCTTLPLSGIGLWRGFQQLFLSTRFLPENTGCQRRELIPICKYIASKYWTGNSRQPVVTSGLRPQMKTQLWKYSMHRMGRCSRGETPKKIG